MAFSSKQENNYESQLEQIAGEVDSYIVKTNGALKRFREQIKPLAQQWKAYYEAVDKREKELLDHWEKVKKNPTLQDKNIKQSEKLEWDKFYLSNLPIGPDDKIQNPKYYMPAKLISIYLKNLKGYIDRNKEKLKTLLFASSECKRLQETIADQEHQYNEIETQYNKLTDEQQENDRIFVEGMWYRYVYSLEEESEKVFGCWRPPLIPLPEHPLKILKPVESGYQRNQTRKELTDARDTQEEYERYYIFLSSVHDNFLQGVKKITEGIWLDNLSIAVLCCLDKGHGNKTAFLKAALERVCQSNHKTDKKKKMWHQTNTFKGAVIALVVALLGGGIPAWLSLVDKTDPPIITSGPNSLVVVNYDSSEPKTKQIAENKFGLSLKEILEEIDSRPVYQRKDAWKYYVGLKVKWRLHLSSVTKWNEKTVEVHMSDMQVPFPLISCSVEISRYPQLKVAKENSVILVSGEISQWHELGIYLSNVSLEFE